MTRKLVGGGRTIVPEILGQNDPVASETLISNRYPLVAHQPLYLSKKSSIITNGKFTMSFPISLIWTACVASKPPKGEPQNAKWTFSLIKFTFFSKKFCYKISLCENFQRRSCKAVTVLSNRAKEVGGDVPFYVKTWPKLTHHLKNTDFPSIFARSALAVTLSEINSINTNRKPTTSMSFPMSLRWTVYCTLPLSSPRGVKTPSDRFSSKVLTIVCDNSETVRDRMSVSINH